MSVEPLLARQLLVVTGKGGVGKSVISAALARLAARAGRRVLLLEVDPRESQHALAGVAPSGGEFVMVAPGLLLQNVQPRRVFEAAVREQLHVELLARRVVKSPIFGHFVDAAPGLKELAVLGHALRVLRGIEPTPLARTDLVVLDAPATGHSVSMLAAPRVVSEVVEAGPFARLASELAELIADPSATGIVVVTMAEEMPVQETLELRESLRARVDRDPDLLVVNGVYPSAEGEDASTGTTSRTDTPLTGALGLWQRRRAINDRELARLRNEWRGLFVIVPLLPRDPGPALLHAVASWLAPPTSVPRT
jgi:anion-transporting  ArsA/GET3 family ATPase